MKNNNLSELIIKLLIESEKDIESLENYYLVSNKAILEEIQKKEKDKEYAIKCLKYLYEIFECKSEEDRIKKIAEINERPFCKNKKFKDIYLIESASDKVINFGMLANLKDKDKYLPGEVAPLLKSFACMMTISSSSILSSEIMLFEKFLSHLFKTLITKNPSAYFTNQTVTIQDLLKTNSASIVNHEINKLVEKEMFDSIQVIRKIEEKENISLDSFEKIVKSFSEIYYRRNLFIHNDGVINEIYISKVGKKKGIKVGERLGCDKEYIEESIVVIQKLMFYACFSILGKDEKDFDETLVNIIQDFCFRSLKNERYKLCEAMYKYLSKYRKIDLSVRKSFYVNYLICLKEQQKDDEFKTALPKLESMADDVLYTIALLLLENKNDSVYNLIQTHYNESNFITAVEIKEWPLFKWFRKTDYYQRLIQDHEKDFESFSLEEGN